MLARRSHAAVTGRSLQLIRGRSVATRALKLYTSPSSRGLLAQWYLKELGREEDVDIVNIDLKLRQHKAPEFMAVNPFGKVPALQDGDMNLFESGALLLYLADKFSGESGVRAPQQRAAAAQWVLFANSTLSNSVFVEQFRDQTMPDVFGCLNRILGEREYLEEGKFGVADVAVGSYLLFVPAYFPQLDLSSYPHVVAYMNRLAARPACAATVMAGAQERAQVTQVAAAAAAEDKQ